MYTIEEVREIVKEVLINFEALESDNICICPVLKRTNGDLLFHEPSPKTQYVIEQLRLHLILNNHLTTRKDLKKQQFYRSWNSWFTSKEERIQFLKHFINNHK